MSSGRLLHGLLDDSASARPDATAVVDGDRASSYGELAARAHQVANQLLELGVAPGDRVGVYLDKSFEAIAAIYGILGAGGAYVPLDPGSPAARLAYIAANCDMRCVVSGVEKQGRWAAIVEHGAPFKHIIVLNGTPTAPAPAGVALVATPAVEAQPDVAPAVVRHDGDLAYILYTSGSTGEPKGVMLSHRNGLAFVEWAVAEYGVTSADRLSSHAPLHFDLSIFDLYAAATTGAALVLVPARASLFAKELAAFIDDAEITVWYSVPSVLNVLSQQGGLGPGSLPKLRTILFAGEVFPTPSLRGLMAALPHVEFANLYGPTETNVCTACRVPVLVDDEQSVPIGVPIWDTEVFAVTAERTRASTGEVGELLVQGPTVMLGYWGDDERTAARLVPHPFEPASSEPCYRTGDLVRLEPDGGWAFVGRTDHQIKSRGHRIELGEVERALCAHPLVAECAVVAVPDELITNRLRAYCAVTGEVTPAELIAFCAERVPRYMIPSEFELWPGLPKTSTGKLDRQALTNKARTP